MEFLSAIVIPDDEESGLKQGCSRPLRASRLDYSYRDWEDTMDDAAALDDAGVTTSPSRKRKRTIDGGSTTSFSVKDFQPAVTVPPAPIIGKRTRNGETYTPAEGTGRVTTREIRQLIDTLKDIITHQVTKPTDRVAPNETNIRFY